MRVLNLLHDISRKVKEKGSQNVATLFNTSPGRSNNDPTAAAFVLEAIEARGSASLRRGKSPSSSSLLLPRCHHCWHYCFLSFFRRTLTYDCCSVVFTSHTPNMNNTLQEVIVVVVRATSSQKSRSCRLLPKTRSKKDRANQIEVRPKLTFP